MIVGVVYMIAVGPIDKVLPPRASHLPDEEDHQDVEAAAETDVKVLVAVKAKAGAKESGSSGHGGHGGLEMDSGGWPVTVVGRGRLALALCSVVTIVVLSATNTLNIDVGALYCCVLLSPLAVSTSPRRTVLLTAV